MKYIDIHAHLQFAAYDEDREDVIERIRQENAGVINVGTQIDTSKSAIELAHKYKNMWAAVGLHPIHTDKSFHDKQELGNIGKEFTSRGENFDYGFYKALGQDEKVVAIGEAGLDYYHLQEQSRQKQKKIFEQQIELANELKKPLMLHIRGGKGANTGDAYNDTLDMLKAYGSRLKENPGNVHFFAGNWDTAKKFLNLGFTLSFTGVITFTNNYDEIVKKAPLDMIMAETDAPYVAPEPYRGKRNEPIFVKYVIKKMAKLRGLSEDEMERQTIANAKRVFKI